MSRLAATVIASAFVIAGAIVAPATVAAPALKPNIVVFMLDDTNPMDGRLWNDPTLTPTLYNTFVAHGIDFTNAIDDTSLCCPSRATFLTGLHSFNHNVTENDVRLFDPSESLAVELTASGYETMLVGKYMNHPEYLIGDLWNRHSAPWSVFDIFTSKYSSTNGYFTNYTVTTKDGQVLTPSQHSTQFITERTIQHIRETAPNKPVFAELSVADTHLPNIPMPGFENDPRWAACDSMPPWNPPNYNEADVSDKPPYVQKLPLQPYLDGWPVATYCKEMLGVDWMVQQVRDQLQADGRLDNTLFMFTADNGMAWGQHRLELKEVPYSTRIPLFMSWPARWGTDGRRIQEYVSNIDLAPTICDAAGCHLGPFPTGQAKPDGVSLLPLVSGVVNDLGRDALIETEWHVHPWAAVRTTDLNDLGLWHYVEYASGFRELYNVDPDEDPWELDNLAYDPQYGDVASALHARLLELLAEGRTDPTGTLTIAQDSLPNNQQDFQFSGDLGPFALDDDADATLPSKQTFANVRAGSYTVSQASVPGWTLISITCPPGSDIDLANGTAVVNVIAGESQTCTFKTARPRPDASIALAEAGPYKGDNIYSATPLKTQTQKLTGVAAGATYDYWIRIQNDGKRPDSMNVAATTSGPTEFAVSVFTGGVDVTSTVFDGSYSTASVDPGQYVVMRIRVAVAADTPTGEKNKVLVTARSETAPTVVDVVRAVTSR